MLTLRRSEDRGHFNHGWLDTYHTFSFADYRDPAHTRFRALRVINEDRVAPGEGFGTHPHEDMEILTYVLSGELAHRDSMGNGSAIRPGEVQRMSAGTGVTHSEANPSKTDPVHLLQIWIFPEKKGLSPSYEQKFFEAEAKDGKLKLVASRDGSEGSVTIHQDVKIWAATVKPGQKIRYSNPGGRHVWLQVARGSPNVQVGSESYELKPGDGASLSESESLELVLRPGASDPAEILLFDLA